MQFRLHFILLLLGSVAGMAQPQGTPNPLALAGAVLDTSGAVIVGAQVTLATQEGKVVMKEITGGSGDFRFPKVSAGNYTIDVTQTGFQEVKQPIKVGSEGRPAIHIIMPVASVNQDLMVSAPDSPAVVSTEISQNQDSNTVDRDALDRLPVFDQDYITTMSRFLDSDATGTNGVTLVVNGIEANGPGVTASAIRSVKINQNPYTALYSRPGRARIEITTKGGTPQFHGSVNFLYRDALFDAQYAFAVTNPLFSHCFAPGSFGAAQASSRRFFTE